MQYENISHRLLDMNSFVNRGSNPLCYIHNAHYILVIFFPKYLIVKLNKNKHELLCNAFIHIYFCWALFSVKLWKRWIGFFCDISCYLMFTNIILYANNNKMYAYLSFMNYYGHLYGYQFNYRTKRFNPIRVWLFRTIP